MQAEHLAILVGIGVVVLLWLALRFGRTMARAALVVAGVVLVGIVALSALVSSLASLQAARTVQTVARTSGASGVLVGLAVGIGGTATAGALAWATVRRWKPLLSEGKQRRKEQRRHALPAGDPPEVVYIDAGDSFDLSSVDLAEWGF